MGKSLGGKVALVTSATRLAGLGAAISHALARAGADIGLGYFRAYDRQQPWTDRKFKACLRQHLGSTPWNPSAPPAGSRVRHGSTRRSAPMPA